MNTVTDHSNPAEFIYHLHVRYEEVVHPWRRKQFTLQPVDDDIRHFVQAMLEWIEIPNAEEFLAAFAGEAAQGAALTPMHKLERLAAYLILRRISRHAAHTRLHAARTTLLHSRGDKPNWSTEMRFVSPGFLSAPRTRRTLLAAAVVPWLQKMTELPSDDPLELSASEKGSLRAILSGSCSTNKINRKEPFCPGEYLTIDLNRCFSARQEPEELYPGVELPCGLGLPRDSLNHLVLLLKAGELSRSRIAAFYRKENPDCYGPDWTQLHSGEKHLAMLGNTAMRWGMREIPRLLISLCSMADIPAESGPVDDRRPQPRLEPLRLRLFEFFEDILIVTWDL